MELMRLLESGELDPEDLEAPVGWGVWSREAETWWPKKDLCMIFDTEIMLKSNILVVYSNIFFQKSTELTHQMKLQP